MTGGGQRRAARQRARVDRSPRQISSIRAGPFWSRARPAGSTSWAGSPTTRDRWCWSCRSRSRPGSPCRRTTRPSWSSRAATRGTNASPIPLADIVPAEPLAYPEARARLTGDPRRAWAAYIAGALVVLQREHGYRLRHGARVLVRSDVPIGKGVSSSAALDVAAFEALAALAGGDLFRTEREVALAAQKVENLVVGAPCGVMDQMTAACGRSRPPARAALPARRGDRSRPAPARAGGFRHRLRNPARGLGRRLRQRPGGRVHGLPHRRGCRRPGGARPRARGAWRSKTASSAATSPTCRRPNGGSIIATPSRKQ